MLTRWCFIVAVLWLAAMTVPPTARAQSPWREAFEGPQPSWRDAGGDAPCRIVQHQRVPRDGRSGSGCEWLQVEGASGTYHHFAHDVGRPRIIEELAPRVWIKADRPGIYLAVRVVLPHTVDPRSGQPMVLLLMGPAYTDARRWQQLQLSGIPTLLMRQIHVLRVQAGPQIDARAAYVDAVLLNVYGGPGATNVWIDDLEVAGYAATEMRPSADRAASPVAAASWNAPPGNASASGAAPLTPVRLPPVETSNAGPRLTADLSPLPSIPPGVGGSMGLTPVVPASDPPPRRKVKLVGSVLLVNERPTFPRVVQHRGEPLGELKRLGFNTVWLQRLPTPEVFEEADRLGLWLICPPPPRSETAMAEIGPMFDPVLAWDLGNDLTDAEFEATERWQRQIRAADRRVNRPLICRPRTNLIGYSRAADLLLIDRRPLGSSLEMTDYATWVRQQPLLARAGTPLWTTVQTQPNESVRQQLLAMEPNSASPLTVSPEQMRLLAYTAVASGSRGLVFLSDSPLDAPDGETRLRAAALELLNLELELIEPWAAAGSLLSMADSTESEVVGVVLRTDHTRLLLPIWLASMSQYVPPQSAANDLALKAPGVPDASKAYELTPSGIKTLLSERPAGGHRVVLREFGLTTQILFAQESTLISKVRDRAREAGRRAAELQRDLAVYKLNTVQAVASQLASRIPVAAAPQWMEAARRDLQSCDRRLAAGDSAEASLDAQRSTRSLRLIERAYWDAAVKGLPSPITSPGAVGFETLPFHWRMVNRLAQCRFGANRIAGGNFEDLNTMLGAGWRFLQHSPNLQTAADLAPEAAQSGRFGLRLSATAADPKKPPKVVETPPALFVSPPVQVDAGQILCLHGWVNVPAPITASTDGLLIVDSLAGEALADRVGKTDGWRQFVLYRVAPQSGSVCLTFALSGLGEAFIDDVSIQIVEGPAALSQR